MFAARQESGYGAGQFPAIAIERGSDPMIYGIPDFGKGFKLAFHHGGRTGEPESFEAPSKAEIDRLHKAALQWLPGILPKALSSWTCSYTNTPDEHFIIDHHPKSDRVILLSCCSGHGYKFAPAIGEIAAQLITDGASKIDISMFGIRRFRRA
jgi:glycine/D-amino acid oxidase-like deaminating enzyme